MRTRSRYCARFTSLGARVGGVREVGIVTVVLGVLLA
jgi:hypothetical protein